MKYHHRTLVVAATLLVVAASLASCGGDEAERATAEDVYSDVEGLSGQERFDKLVELAEQAGGKITFYYAGEWETIVKPFEEKTGLEVEAVKASGEGVAERVCQEAKANRAGSDVFMVGVEEPPFLRDCDAVAPLTTVVTDDLDPEFVGEDVVSPALIPIVPSFNTELMDPAEQPASWLEFFENLDVKKAIDATDWRWFKTVSEHLMETEGMSEADAIDTVTKGMSGAFIVDGHTALATFLASGQYAYAPTQYYTYTAEAEQTGAPVSYEGLTMEAINNGPFAMGLSAGSPNPAGGLLFLEYFFTEESQAAVDELGWAHTSDALTEKSILEQFPETLSFSGTLADPPSEDEVNKWKDAFDQFIQKIGGQVLTED